MDINRITNQNNIGFINDIQKNSQGCFYTQKDIWPIPQ